MNISLDDSGNLNLLREKLVWANTFSLLPQDTTNYPLVERASCFWVANKIYGL